MFREVEDIVETLERARDRGRKCSVLIGAGCSVTAGIPTAQGFVNIIKDRHPRDYERAEIKSYPYCMAQLSRDEQRSLIAEFVDKAKINWGHIALAQMMQMGFVDRVLTTNFDPLIMRACSLIGLYPATYDLAASQHFEPDKVPDPAIFHLHGQRSGFILLNSEKSLHEHSQKLAPIFEDAGRGRVWLVVGYSGESDPVFDHLAKVNCFDNKLYWIGYKDSEPADHLREKLLKEEKYAFYTKGFDADSFFVTLAQNLNCFPPDFVGKPFSYLGGLFNQLTEYTLPKTESPIDALKIARSYVEEAIQKIEGAKSEILDATSNLLSGEYDRVVEIHSKVREKSDIDATILSAANNAKGAQIFQEALTKNGDDFFVLLNHAKEKFETALDIQPDNDDALNNLGNVLGEIAKLEKGKNTDEMFKKAIENYENALKINPKNYMILYNWGTVLLNWAKMKNGEDTVKLLTLAEEKFESVISMNPNVNEALNNLGICLLELVKIKKGQEGQEAFRKAERTFLHSEEIRQGHSSYNLACLYSLVGQEDKCQQWLVKSKKVGSLPSMDHLMKDADLNQVRNKKWFIEFLNGLNN